MAVRIDINNNSEALDYDLRKYFQSGKLNFLIG